MKVMSKEEYLGRVAYSVMDIGYIKANGGSDMPTWEIAMNIDETSPEATKLVESALSWVSNIEPKNSYEERLKEVCLKENLDLMNLPMLASLIPSYNRSIKFKEKIDSDNKILCESSNYIGKEGDCIEVDVARVKVARFGGFKGLTNIYQFIDKDNNVYAWKTNSTNTLYESCKKIKGNIKGYKEWNGIKETVLRNVEVI